MPKRNIPQLMVTRFYQTDEGHWLAEAWCPFCRQFHTHGAAGGHRVSHCHSKESPFSELGCGNGYILVAPKELAKGLPEQERADWKGYTR